MDPTAFICSSVDGRLGCCHLPVVVNGSPWTWACRSLSPRFQSPWVHTWLWNCGSRGNCLAFGGATRLFHRGCPIFHSRLAETPDCRWKVSMRGGTRRQPCPHCPSSAGAGPLPGPPRLPDCHRGRRGLGGEGGGDAGACSPSLAPPPTRRPARTR